jgi:hypothetical protein
MSVTLIHMSSLVALSVDTRALTQRRLQVPEDLPLPLNLQSGQRAAQQLNLRDQRPPIC